MDKTWAGLGFEKKIFSSNKNFLVSKMRYNLVVYKTTFGVNFNVCAAVRPHFKASGKNHNSSQFQQNQICAQMIDVTDGEMERRREGEK